MKFTEVNLDYLYLYLKIFDLYILYFLQKTLIFRNNLLFSVKLLFINHLTHYFVNLVILVFFYIILSVFVNIKIFIIINIFN